MTDHSQLVKPLQWFIARTLGGSAWVGRGVFNNEFARIDFDANRESENSERIAKVKAAADAQYAARILSALNLDAIDALQARVAELEKLAQRITNEGRIASGGVRRPAKYIQIPADLFSIARALMERKPS